MAMAPIVNGLSEEFEGRVSAVQLNAALPANARIQVDLGLTGHPSFAVLDKDGLITGRFFGPQPELVLREAMEIVSTK